MHHSDWLDSEFNHLPKLLHTLTFFLCMCIAFSSLLRRLTPNGGEREKVDNWRKYGAKVFS
jgi:hypothetical protein